MGGRATSTNGRFGSVDKSISEKANFSFNRGMTTTSSSVTATTASTSKTTGALTVAGGIGVSLASNFGNDITAFASSDKRLKTNIQSIENPLEKISKLGGYTFEWIPNEDIHPNTGNDVGVIAQEVEEVIPEVTTTRDNGYKAVKYEKLVPLLIESIKQQQQQIKELQEKVKLLEKV